MHKTLETPTDLLILISKILQELTIDFFVSGGYAVCVWGRPRFTADIDIVINLEEKNIPNLATTLKENLPDAYIDEEQMLHALHHQGEFNVIEPSLGMKVDFFILNNVEYDKLTLRRSIKKDIGRMVRFISPEDLIISKLKWFKQDESSRHLEDIKTVLRISKVDQNYIEEWIKKLNLSKEYKRAKELNANQ